MIFSKIIIVIKTKVKYFIFKYKWKRKNIHNKIRPMNYFPLSLVDVGKYSYGPLNVSYWGIKKEKLQIGNFVSIAEGVKFILGGNHEINTFTTYPLKVMLLNEDVEALTKGPIIIKDDVWIGNNVLVLSGITVGQGAIIGAGSVVTKDVPPYAVVAGNPAKVIKYRYSQEIIEEMVAFDWSKIDLKKIKKLKNELYKPLTLDLVKELKKEFGEN